MAQKKIDIVTWLKNWFEQTSNKVTSWGNTPSNDNYPSEKLVKDSLDSKASIDSVNNLGSALNSNLSTVAEDITGKEDKSNKITSLNGMLTESDTHYPSSLLVLNHLDTKEDISNKVTSMTAMSTDDEYPSAKCVYDKIEERIDDVFGHIPQDLGAMAYEDNVDRYVGAVALSNDYEDLDNKPTIPTATSDLTNDNGFITSSSVPSASSTVPNADTTTGSYGSGTSYARSNHTHPKSSLYAEATHTHSEYVNPTIIDNLTTDDATKALSAKQGKVLNDMIGDAIEYINQ